MVGKMEKKMRELTLDEKISIKGLLAYWGFHKMKGLTMSSALYWCSVCYGGSAGDWHQWTIKVKNRVSVRTKIRIENRRKKNGS
ncbi:MAG: hypothetical protein GY941_15690 [Planctomycetes bacterium]|nr:hypothetical protein [Planctomycetota bacterium]